MMKHLPTYQSRFGQNCRQLDNEAEPCWGLVQGSSRGIECKGHWGGGPYMSPEAVVRELATAKAAAERAAAEKAVEEERKAAEREANRWFRKHIDAAGKLPSNPWWVQLSEPMLNMVFSMIGEGINSLWHEHEQATRAALEEAGLPAIAEVQRRGLDWPVGAYELKLAPQRRESVIITPDARDYWTEFDGDVLDIDLTNMPNHELMLWYGCAAHVVDYSMLERGVRQIIMHLYCVTNNELRRRKLQPTYLFDLELG